MCFLASLLKINCPYVCEFISRLSSVPFVCVSHFLLTPHCFDGCSFVVCFEVRECETSRFVLFFLTTALAFRGLLWLHTNLIYFFFCSVSSENAIGTLMGIVLNLRIALGHTAFLTMRLPKDTFLRTFPC